MFRAVCLLALVALLPVADAKPIWGVDKRGAAFVCWHDQGPVLSFCYTLTLERR